MNPAAKPQESIISLWMDVGRMLQQHMMSMFKDKAVNPLQLHAVHLIMEHPGMTMKEFAGYLHVTSPSATSLVNRLVKQKLVIRKADPRNRKLVRLHVGAAGSKKVQSHLNEFRKGLGTTLSLLSAEDQRDFARVLGNLRAALNKELS